MSDYEPIEQRYEGLASPMSDYGCSEPTRCEQRDKAECEWCMNPMSDRRNDFERDLEVVRRYSGLGTLARRDNAYDRIIAYVTELEAENERLKLRLREEDTHHRSHQERAHELRADRDKYKAMAELEDIHG